MSEDTAVYTTLVRVERLLAAAREVATYLQEVGTGLLDLDDPDGGGCGAVLRPLQEAIDQVEACAPPWIPVEERLPEPLTDVLAVIDDDEGPLVVSLFRLRCDPSRWCYSGDGETCSASPTHWMPLPEPPVEAVR